jgi:hypothetical protein
MSLTVQILQKISGVQQSALDVSTASLPINYNKTNNLSNGTGADQANQIFTDERTISASGNEDLDLAGSLSDAFGNTITFSKLKAITVVASSDNTNNVQVTRPASNGVPLFMTAGDGISLTPGASFTAVFPDANGVAVTASTGDLLNIANSAGGSGVTYTIILIGTE